MINEIILLVVLLLLSACRAEDEPAMFSISNTKIRYLAKEGRNTDILIERTKSDSHRLLTTILIGNNRATARASIERLRPRLSAYTLTTRPPT